MMNSILDALCYKAETSRYLLTIATLCKAQECQGFVNGRIVSKHIVERRRFQIVKWHCYKTLASWWTTCKQAVNGFQSIVGYISECARHCFDDYAGKSNVVLGLARL